MIQTYEIENDSSFREMFSAIDKSDRCVEMVVPFAGGKSFAFQQEMVGKMNELHSEGAIVLVSFNQRKTVFTSAIIEEINQSFVEQKAALKACR